MGEQRVLRLRIRTFTVHLGPGIRGVDLNMLDRHSGYDLDAALGVDTAFKFEEDLVLDLRIPRIIVVAGLDHGTGRRHGIAAALQLDRVEMRPVGHMIGGVALALDQIAGLEIDEPIRTGPHRLQVCRRLARIGAFIGREHVFGDKQAVRATCPKRCRFLEADAHSK